VSHPAAAYVTKKLLELDAAMGTTVPRVLENADEEAIHDLRVAIRRMRTLLKMSRALFGRWHTDVVREAFAEVMRATGELRDEEVLEETLEGASPHPSFGHWLGGRKQREEALRRNVVSRIERGDLDRARILLKALMVFPVEPKRDHELSLFARKAVERARRKVEQRRDVAPEDAVGLHDLRIAYKELRYSIELMAEALPIDARAQLEPATVFQKRLGELHDVDVAIEVIASAKGIPEEAREQALLALSDKREKRIAKYLRELDPLAHGKPGAKEPNEGSNSTA
jgi:CHAD domain-containing protein